MSDSEIPFTYAHAAIMVSNLERSAEFYERAGLPDDLYGYKSWK